jgi:hypothetical protein
MRGKAPSGCETTARVALRIFAKGSFSPTSFIKSDCGMAGLVTVNQYFSLWEAAAPATILKDSSRNEGFT